MPKVKPFGIGDVDDLINAKNEFNSEVVPKGVYQFKVKRMTHGTIRKEGPNKGKSRFGILLEVVGPKKVPAKYMGAGVWSSINVIDSGAGNCNDFINALAGPDEKAQAALRKAFWTPDITIDKEGNVKKIGRKVIGSPDGQIIVTGRTKIGKDNDKNDRADIAAWLLPKGSRDDDDEDDEDFEEEDLDEDDVDEDEEDSDDDDDADDAESDDEDEEENELREELEELSAVALRKRAKANGSTVAEVKGKSEEELIDIIVGQEIEDDKEDDEEDDEEDEEEDEEDEEDEAETELREELDELGVVALRKRAKEAGATVAETKGKDKEALIDIVVAKELADEDDGEGEEEPF